MILGPGPSFPFSLLRFTSVSHSASVRVGYSLGIGAPGAVGSPHGAGRAGGGGGGGGGGSTGSPSPGISLLTCRDRLSPQGQDWGPDNWVLGGAQV